jgi:hypothetical protein
MQTKKHTTLKYLLTGILVSGFMLYGADTKSATATNKVGNIGELMNIAGKQRMLSQRIAKDYLYISKKVAVDKATKQLGLSFALFKKNQKYLDSTINDAEIKNLITFVNMSEKELEDTSKKPFNLDNAQLVLDLSESMLEGSQYIVDSLKKLSKTQDSAIVATSGKQRMLAQRIAKYYIAYQSGIKDKNTVEQMKETVRDFSQNNRKLLDNPSNTAKISQDLKKVDQLWKIVHKFYLNIEKGGLPFIVYTSTDDITSKMDKITTLYNKLGL